MSDNVPVLVNKEAQNEDNTRVFARHCFGRMHSGSDSCANGNANLTNGNTHPANRNPDEHTWSNQHADA